jgi:hypothetical protein
MGKCDIFLQQWSSQGTLIEGKGSVQMTSSVNFLLYKKQIMFVISKAANLNGAMTLSIIISKKRHTE